LIEPWPLAHPREPFNVAAGDAIFGDFKLKTIQSSRLAALLALVASLCTFAPGVALACACGCGVFEVGTSALFPSGSGGLAYLEYDFMNQNQNRSGASRAPAADNPDKQIRTDFFTLGGQYMFNHQWGVMVEAPYWSRTFRTDDGAGVDTFKTSNLGDIRLKAMYTGFSHDLSSGITFGVKLPTGEFRNPNFDRDTEIGTGSTDLLIGAYHLGKLTKDNSFSYFVQAEWDKPIASQGGYRPGAELDAAVGVYYGGFSAAGGTLKISPVLQVVGSQRQRDNGPNSNAGDSGFSRMIISPGVELAAGDWKLYGDVEIPIYERFNGDQLAARETFKLIVSRAF
jgi:hypothetical protein